ncbi:MAG: cation:proton antiporter [Chloroflexota bacterium]|nr:cation:proton antiporter [Chloroflexota bacterium]
MPFISELPFLDGLVFSSGGGGEEGAAFATTLFSLFVLFVAAKIGEEVFRRINQPGVIGELLGGFIVGPFALGLADVTLTAEVFAELGVVILLFTVGLEVRIDDLMAVGPMAIAVGTIGFILPIIAGTVIGVVIGADMLAAVLIGLALAATSIGITSRVLAEMGVLDRAFARVILGAAIVDDILALLAIGLLSGFAEGELGIDTVLTLVAGVAFVGIGLALAPLGRRVPRKVFVWPKFADTPVVPVFIIMFAGALLAQFVGLAAIIGAFVVGLIIAETPVREEVEHGFRSLLGIFAPFFFAVTGANIDMSALLDPELLIIVLVLAVMGVLTKLVGGIAGSWRLGKWNSIVVGVGMSPRGEVGIVVAALGLSLALVDREVYAVLLAAVILTTLVAPVMLQWAVPKASRDERHHEAGTGAA